MAVCCIDLDSFKLINDSLGHELEMLFQAGQRAAQHCPYGRSIRWPAMVATSSSWRCAISQKHRMRPTICQRLLKDLSAPFLVDGHSLTVTASIGISIFPDHGDTSDLLLRNADMALQAAKRAGRGKAQVYSPALGRQTRRAAEMVDALLTAVGQAQFRMAYQPISQHEQRDRGL